MVLSLKNNLPGIIIFVMLVHFSLLVAPSQALRKTRVGDVMPEFTLEELFLDDSNRPDPNKVLFVYKHSQNQVLAMAYISANQRQSQQAVDDILAVVKELRAKVESFDFVIATNNPKSLSYFQSVRKEPQLGFRILLDNEYKLWGQLGIIATPTVLIVGTDDKVLWIKAGYGYDFAPAMRSRLSYVLGITKQDVFEESISVKTLANTTITARLKRHLRMAGILEQKGRLEAAIQEVHKARQLDPNSIEAILELGLLYCKTGQSKQALEVVGQINAQNHREIAKRTLILGWAKRQIGEFDTAEKLLVEATRLNPKSTRGFFELGKLYQAKGQAEKAVDAYYRALALVFNEPVKTSLSHQ